MTPETDEAFRQRILQVIDPDLRADAVIATGYGLDGLGSLNGLRRKGLPEESFEDPVVEAFRQVERDMAQPSIVPMAPGERPTEPGWYVAEITLAGQRTRTIVEIDSIDDDPDPSENEGAYLSFVGLDHGRRAADVAATFIARIYPDRIEGREG